MANEQKIEELNTQINQLNLETQDIDNRLRINRNSSEEVYQQGRLSQQLFSDIKEFWHEDKEMLGWFSNVSDDVNVQFRKTQSYFDEKEDELRINKRQKENTIEDTIYIKRVLETGE